MKALRYLALAAALLTPSLALSQPGPFALCTPLFNSSTGAVSCIPVGQTSPNITTPNSLPVGGLATTAAPTYTTATVNPLSLDTSGNLRVTGTFTPSGTSPEFTPVAPAAATATAGVLLGAQATTGAVNPTNGQQGALSSDTNNNLLVSSGGAPNLTIAQVSIATSDTSAVAARALRRSVTIQQITGTQNVFCNQTTATAGNGVVLPAVVGASFTFNTTSAIRCIAITGAQTVAVAETF